MRTLYTSTTQSHRAGLAVQKGAKQDQVSITNDFYFQLTSADLRFLMRKWKFLCGFILMKFATSNFGQNNYMQNYQHIQHCQIDLKLL